MRIALVGTRGVPAQYGGFETCVEEVGWRLADRGHDVTVYCRRTNEWPHDGAGASARRAPVVYRGMRLVRLPALKRRSLETLSHTSLSVLDLVRRGTDVAVMFNAANAPFLPALRGRGIPVATHVDGLEWKRAKWGSVGRRYYRAAESLAVRWSDALIADAEGIQEYYWQEFAARSVLIAYGAPLITNCRPSLVAAHGLVPRGYHLVVARFEPENHVDMIVEGYRSSGASAPLVVVGAAPYSDAYTRRVHSLADDRVRFLGAVWDQDLLDQLYANALSYLHGHSVGGTNPSLLRAIGAGAATNAFDVGFNREVLGDAGRWFRSPADVAALIEEAEADPDGTAGRGEAARARAGTYDWDQVAKEYERLCEELAAGRVPERRPTGRRRRPNRDGEVMSWSRSR